MVKPEVNVLKDASKSANALVAMQRKRSRRGKKKRGGIVVAKKGSFNESSHLPSPAEHPSPRISTRNYRSASSYSPTGSYVPNDLSGASEASCSSPALGTNTCADASVHNSENKVPDELSRTSSELVDVQELWDHYFTRAEYQAILSNSLSKYSKKNGRSQNRQDVIEKITHLKRIEQCIAKGIKQITTFEFFNYVNPLCPGLSDVTTEVYIVSCSADKVIQKDFLNSVIVPCRSTQHQKPPVLYYAVPPLVEKGAVNVYLVVKVHIEQRYHYIGSARRIGRSRSDAEPDVKEFPILKRVLYGVRKIGSGGRDGMSPRFGNHTVALVNSDTDSIHGISFKFTEEKWMWNCAQLSEFARIGNKLCSSGPIGLINFGISDEHVEYDWSMVEEVVDARMRRRKEQMKSNDVYVWYHCKGARVGSETPTTARCSPSSDKENRNVRPSSRRTPRTSQKSSFKTPPQKNTRSSAIFDYTLPPGVLDRVPGLLCPFTRKVFHSVGDLEQHLRCSYPVFKFEKITDTSSVIHFDVSSIISREEWENPRTEREQRKVVVRAVSPNHKPQYAPPEELPVKKKNDLPKAQMIPFGEMSFVHPTYSQVPGPSSSKVYHSVIEDTCDWKSHLMERNIRDYIDDTPQEKEFMLLHNRFRSKFRHSIVGEKLTLDFYTKFVECCGLEMKAKRIRAHCVARLTRLVQQDKMTPTNMAALTQKLYELGPNDPD